MISIALDMLGQYDAAGNRASNPKESSALYPMTRKWAAMRSPQKSQVMRAHREKRPIGQGGLETVALLRFAAMITMPITEPKIELTRIVPKAPNGPQKRADHRDELHVAQAEALAPGRPLIGPGREPEPEAAEERAEWPRS